MYRLIKNMFMVVVLFAPHITAYNRSLSMITFNRFRVCGAYCGAGWCNNKWIDENKCDTSVEPEHHIITGDSCGDSCCKTHDQCCGQDKTLQKNCNKEIVDCLSKCDHFSLTCTFDGIPTPAGEIELAMSIVDNWCCGTQCLKNKQHSHDKKDSSQQWGWGGAENLVNWPE